MTGYLGGISGSSLWLSVVFSLWAGEARVPYFIICIPGCIDLEGQFGGGRKKGNCGDWSPCVEGSLFGDHSWGDLCRPELGDASTHFENLFQRPITACPCWFLLPHGVLCNQEAGSFQLSLSYMREWRSKQSVTLDVVWPWVEFPSEQLSVSQHHICYQMWSQESVVFLYIF